MPSARRLAVLSLLGIEQWVPRARVAEFLASEAPAAASPDTLAVGGATHGAAANTAPPALSMGTPATAMPVAPAVPAAPTRLAAPPPAPDASIPQAPPAAGGDTLLLGVARLPHGVLMLATAQLPGLTGAQHALLARMGAALAGTPPTVEEFAWPPPGTRIPGADRPGEADRALGLRLNEEQARGLTAVVLAGSDQAQRVARLLGDAAPLVVVPSLAEMLADPACKRAAWDAMRHLARPA
jgi:hypothetical protein